MAFFAFHKGQALPEYALILGLVVVPGIAAFILLSGDVNDLFAGIISRDGGGSTVAVAAPASGGGGGGGQTSGPTASAGGTLTLSNGTTIDLSGYPADLARSLQTSGANGTTEKLLASLNAIIQGMKESGELTPEQANHLANMANVGHEMAEIEKLVVDAYEASGNDLARFRDANVGYGGQAVNVIELARSIGFSTGANVDQSRAALLREHFDAAVASGALKDPVARNSVEVLMNQIANVANGVESAAQAFVDSTDEPGQFYHRMTIALAERDEVMGTHTATQTLYAENPELVTHEDSAAICGQGHGSDNGTHCSTP